MRQWHPLFAKILRPWVEHSYEVFANVSVGDVPREADILLLRRLDRSAHRFEGLWKHLSLWSILEFKGPSVTARWRDLDSLVELGLGIARRMNEQGAKRGKRPTAVEQVSFWYVANQLSPAFLERCASRIGQLQSTEAGLWRGRVLSHPVTLVSRVDLAIEDDTIPLHLVAKEPIQTAAAVARYLLEHDELWERCGEWFRALHPEAWEEVKDMAAVKNKKFDINLVPLIEDVGVKEVIRQIGAKRFVSEGGLKAVLHDVTLDQLLSDLTPAQRQTLKKLLK